MSVKRVSLVAGLGAVAVMAAMSVDRSAAVHAGAAAPPAAATVVATTSVTDYSFAASPTLHASEGGKCVKSSPNC